MYFGVCALPMHRCSKAHKYTCRGIHRNTDSINNLLFLMLDIFLISRLCSFEKWNKSNSAANKIVLCFSTVGQVSSTGAAFAVLQASGSALIFAEPFTKQTLQDDFFPTIHVDLYQATQMLYYIRSTR